MIDVVVKENVRKIGCFKAVAYSAQITIPIDENLPKEIKDRILSSKFSYDGEEEYSEVICTIECIDDIANVSKAFNKQVVWCIRNGWTGWLISYSFSSNKLLTRFVTDIKKLL